MQTIRTGGFLTLVVGILILAAGFAYAEPPPTADYMSTIEMSINIGEHDTSVQATTVNDLLLGTTSALTGPAAVATNTFRPDPGGVILYESDYDATIHGTDDFELNGGAMLTMRRPLSGAAIVGFYEMYITTSTVEVNPKHCDGQEVRQQYRYATPFANFNRERSAVQQV